MWEIDTRVMEVYRILLGAYGEQGWWPVRGTYSASFKKRRRTPAERFEICVGAILAQNTSWKNAEKALDNLREVGALKRKTMEKLGQKELATLIRPAGYYNTKAKKLKEFLKYSGRISRAGLLGIWGCGPETVDSILLYAYGKPVFVVDAYARRIFSRLGLCRLEKGGNSYGKLQEYFMESVPQDPEIFNEYHALIVGHAKKHCRAKPECSGCPLKKLCKKELRIV